MAYTEDTLVQQASAVYLEQQLGWGEVYAYNNQDFGPRSLLGRGSDREKDRVTIEKTFEELLRFMDGLSEEDLRAMREGLDEESLAIFDLLRKKELRPPDIKRIKAVAVGLLEKLKGEKLSVDHWRDKEATRDAVRIAIRDFLWSDETGLPVGAYDEDEVNDKAEAVFVHVFRAYPTVPSPYYAAAAS